MRLIELAEHLERLEKTSGRIAMITLVADLLRRASGDERGSVVYLLQAQLRPPYEGAEVGLGEKLLVKAIAAAYDAGEASVRRRFRAVGDLGLVAEGLATPRPQNRVTVRRAHEAL